MTDAVNTDEPQGTPEEPVVEDKVVDPAEGTTPAETPAESPAEKPEEEPAKDKADEPEADDAEDTPEETDDFDYSEYDSPALKQAVVLLREANIPVEQSNAIFAEAVDSGDLSKIDTTKLVELMGQDKADVVLMLAENYFNKQTASMKTITDEAHALTGGKENFDAMRTWATEKMGTDPAFAKEFLEFRAMLDSGQPRTIKAAVTELFSLYKADPGTTIEANLEVGDKKVSGDTGALSRTDYIQAIDKAQKNRTYEKVRESLWHRRQAGMKKGI